MWKGNTYKVFVGKSVGMGRIAEESVGIDESTILKWILKWNGITSMYLDHYSDKGWAILNARQMWRGVLS